MHMNLNLDCIALIITSSFKVECEPFQFYLGQMMNFLYVRDKVVFH